MNPMSSLADTKIMNEMPKVNTFSTGHENMRPATERY